MSGLYLYCFKFSRFDKVVERVENMVSVLVRQQLNIFQAF